MSVVLVPLPLEEDPSPVVYLTPGFPLFLHKFFLPMEAIVRYLLLSDYLNHNSVNSTPPSRDKTLGLKMPRSTCCHQAVGHNIDICHYPCSCGQNCTLGIHPLGGKSHRERGDQRRGRMPRLNQPSHLQHNDNSLYHGIRCDIWCWECLKK